MHPSMTYRQHDQTSHTVVEHSDHGSRHTATVSRRDERNCKKQPIGTGVIPRIEWSGRDDAVQRQW